MFDSYMEEFGHLPRFIGPLTESASTNARYITEDRVRLNLWRYFVNGESDF